MALTREIGKSSSIRLWHQYHPSIYWVYGQRESFDWKRMTVKELDSQFHELWLIASSMAKHGHEFIRPVAPANQIGAVDSLPAPKEVALKTCSSMLSMFGKQHIEREDNSGFAHAQLEKARNLLREGQS